MMQSYTPSKASSSLSISWEANKVDDSWASDVKGNNGSGAFYQYSL